MYDHFIIYLVNFMILFQLHLSEYIYKCYITYFLIKKIIKSPSITKRNVYHLLNQIQIMGIGSLTIVLLTAFFIGMVFTFQVAKEFVALNTINLVGSVLTITFVRELSPVLTAIIVAGRIGSAFTAELATMKVTEQIDALYILNIDPIHYLIIPRLYACIFMLPLLNIFALATSISSSIFVGSILYSIPVSVLLSSSNISLLDFSCSLLKATAFGFIIGIISCSWGLSTTGSSKNVGKSTTSSVVTILLIVFIVDFILSYFMFNTSHSVLQI